MKFSLSMKPWKLADLNIDVFTSRIGEEFTVLPSMARAYNRSPYLYSCTFVTYCIAFISIITMKSVLLFNAHFDNNNIDKQEIYETDVISPFKIEKHEWNYFMSRRY